MYFIDMIGNIENMFIYVLLLFFFFLIKIYINVISNREEQNSVSKESCKIPGVGGGGKGRP